MIKSFVPKLMGLRLMALYKIKPKKAIHKAFMLFCTPRSGFVKPHQKDYLKAHQSKTIEFKKIKIQTYHWPGNGSKVLLIHGWDSHTYRWKDLITKLKAQDYDITAFDAPAHGYSEGNILNVPIYSEVLQKMLNQYKPEILIGHSVGAMTCIFNQHLQQDSNISKMVLLGSPSEMQRVMKGFQKILGLSDSFMKVTQDYFKERYGYTFSEFSMAKFGAYIKVPCLIIHDKYDKVVPYKEAISINKTIRHAELIITEGAGHSLYAKSIDEAIINFLQS
ncbi:alpha/beta fold hydrolase [Flavobacteriaceae bacterium 14752]|uniref:alpha/beta fold hydrolase n=1 Tax=Mesohalobacter salilacus TaxID=2491711 RepID=UPI000F63380E|nr:alpha/beta hydrolase [Flavobacteriaceae bacterium 14752]